MPIGSNNDTGDVLQISGLSAGALNADLVPSTFVGQYKWISLYLGTDSYNGILEPQVSFNPSDSTSWKTIKMYPMTSLDSGDVSAAGFDSVTNAIYGAPVIAPYFRVRMTTYTSDFATGILQLYANGLSGFQLIDTYVRILTAANHIGYINNDGTQNIEIAAGTATDTVVSGSGGILARVLVTTLGTHQMNFYDNASAGSGTVVGIVPASAAAGTIIECKAPCSNGCTAKGDSNNPAVTVFF